MCLTCVSGATASVKHKSVKIIVVLLVIGAGLGAHALQFAITITPVERATATQFGSIIDMAKIN